MSRAEASVLIANIIAAIDDFKDLKWSDATPLHVASATDAHIRHLTEAAKELGRIHGISA